MIYDKEGKMVLHVCTYCNSKMLTKFADGGDVVEEWVCVNERCELNTKRVLV